MNVMFLNINFGEKRTGIETSSLLRARMFKKDWLSYAANEITIYDPDDKYFNFGLNNFNGRLDYIYDRDTTYPTFLELTMAAYKMVAKIKFLKKD